MQNDKCTVLVNGQTVVADRCLHDVLGDTIDIQWLKEKGQMHLSSSKLDHIVHQVGEKQERFLGVPFRHSPECPFHDKELAVNPKRPMRPCSVAMIQDADNRKILATQRPLNITFGGKWVLPGGHLQRGETIMEGGIRECEEEVCLDRQAIRDVHKDYLMAWESVFAVQGQIKATALVFFFRLQSGPFDVKGDPKEIAQWQWRQFEGQGQPWGDGWALGHLWFMRLLRKHIQEVQKLQGQ